MVDINVDTIFHGVKLKRNIHNQDISWFVVGYIGKKHGRNTEQNFTGTSPDTKVLLLNH